MSANLDSFILKSDENLFEKTDVKSLNNYISLFKCEMKIRRNQKLYYRTHISFSLIL